MVAAPDFVPAGAVDPADALESVTVTVPPPLPPAPVESAVPAGEVEGAELRSRYETLASIEEARENRSNTPVGLLEDPHVRDLKVRVVEICWNRDEVETGARARLREDIRLSRKVSAQGDVLK